MNVFFFINEIRLFKIFRLQKHKSCINLNYWFCFFFFVPALDAYCLLEVYEVISKQLDEIGIEIDDFIDNLNAELKAKSQKTRKKNKIPQIQKVQKEENIPPGPNSKPVR